MQILRVSDMLLLQMSCCTEPLLMSKRLMSSNELVQLSGTLMCGTLAYWLPGTCFVVFCTWPVSVMYYCSDGVKERQHFVHARQSTPCLLLLYPRLVYKSQTLQTM
jgi:serine protease inhibitor ecotin